MKKRILKSENERKNVDENKLKEYQCILEKMINCKTVYDDKLTNKEEFIKFNKVVEESFPTLIKNSTKLTFGSGCFVYVIEGKNATKNIMLMSHHDVVSETKGWETDAFKATIKDGKLYGRGSIDTKTPLFACLEACEELLKEGFEFENYNLYIGSSNNEEVAGDGMVLATKYFKENGIYFDTVLDEGGAITTNMIPGYEGKSAMVAVHEKSRHLYKCEVVLNEIGHKGLSASNQNVVVSMSKFINEVMETKIFNAKFYPEVESTFKRHVPYMKFPMNFVFKHLKLFGPIVKKIMLKMKEASPMLGTSVSFTNFIAGDATNSQLKAKVATASMFLRCVREEDLKEELKKIKEIAKKYNVTISEIERDYCHPCRFDTAPFKLLETIMNNNFPDVVVAPFLLTAGTDARRLTDVATNILRFAPIDLNKEQFNSIHGDNEHIYLKNVGQCVLFYKDYLKKYGEI